jgi:hypothetical protein
MHPSVCLHIHLDQHIDGLLFVSYLVSILILLGLLINDHLLPEVFPFLLFFSMATAVLHIDMRVHMLIFALCCPICFLSGDCLFWHSIEDKQRMRIKVLYSFERKSSGHHWWLCRLIPSSDDEVQSVGMEYIDLVHR